MTKKRAVLDAVYLSGVHMNYWAGTTIESTYLVAFMTIVGYSATETGMVVAASYISGLLMQPFWGYMSDRYKNVKRSIIVCLTCTTTLVLLLKNAIENGVLYTVFLYMVLGCFKGPVVGLLDSLTYDGAEKNKYVHYSLARGSGSLFSAIVMLASGKILDNIGIQYAFMMEAVLLVLAVVSSALYTGKRYQKAVTEKEQEYPISIKDTVHQVIRNKALICLAVSVILLNIGINATYTLSPRMIVEMGGSVADNGWAMAINTAGMMPCMMLYSYMLEKRKISNPLLYLLASTFSVLRILSLALVNTLPVMFGIQILGSLQYGFLQPAMLTEISILTNKRIRTTTITLITSLQTGFSYVVGSLVTGKIFDQYGNRVVFIVFAGVAIMGAISYMGTIYFRKKEAVV